MRTYINLEALALLMACGCSEASATQPTYDTAYSINSGCTETGASGYYTVDNNGTRQAVLVLDDDGDGLPEWARCGDDTNAFVALAAGSNTSCSTTTVLTSSSHGCSFNVYVYVGTAGYDSVTCGASVPYMMFGGEGNDVLTGGPDGDFIHGGLGEDVLGGAAGNDYICTGPGGVEIQTDGVNEANGGAGDDILFGGPPTDEMNGNAGNDMVMGAISDDDLFGGANDDAVIGAPQDDTVQGEGGDDWVVGNMGDDILKGGSGDDKVIALSASTDTTINGNDGADDCLYDTGNEITALNDSTSTPTNCNAVGQKACGRYLFVIQRQHQVPL